MTTDIDSGPTAAKKTVLVVDDDLSILRLLDVNLTAAGFLFKEAGSVGEAWRIVQDDPPDALIVDIHLPGTFGWELGERLRLDQRLHRTPIAFITGEVNAADKERARRLDAPLLMKPFEPHELIELIASMLDETVRVPVRRVEATIFTDVHRIEGTLHLPEDHSRFSDAWEALMGDKRSHIPLTDVTIYGASDTPLAKSAFLEVAKAKIQLVMPADESRSGSPRLG